MKINLYAGSLAVVVLLGLVGSTAIPARAGTIVNIDSGGPISAAYNSTTKYYFTVSGVGQIADVDVRFSGYSTWISDIWVRLTSPQSTQFVLFNGINATNPNDNFQDTYLDDESPNGNIGKSGYTTPPWAGPEYVGGSTYKPSYDLLSKFDGQNADGTWMLEVHNLYGSPGYVYQAGQTPRWGGTAIGTQLIFTPVPEPSTLSLIAIGLFTASGWFFLRRRRTAE